MEEEVEEERGGNDTPATTTLDSIHDYRHKTQKDKNNSSEVEVEVEREKERETQETSAHKGREDR